MEYLGGMDPANFLGLRTAVYAAPQLAEARAWYVEALGIEPYFDKPFYVGFNVEGYELGLDPDRAVATGDGGTACYWGVDDARAAYARLIELGATAASEPQEVGGGIIVASVRDPFGNLLVVIQNPNFPNLD